MRDPMGSVSFGENAVKRRLAEKLPNGHFLQSSFSRALVKKGALVDFHVENLQITSPLIPFVSYPFEWCDAQFRDAAYLTLSISKEISGSYELKDASAWNILFDGSVPVFCDHLSFQPIEYDNWWAFGQFVRHFVLPLFVSVERNLKACESFKLNRDGLSPDIARSLIGTRRFLTRYWVLMTNFGKGDGYPKNMTKHIGSSFHSNLYAISEWFLDGLNKSTGVQSVWGNYTENRSHYTERALEKKRTLIAKWLQTINPKWVIDLGCNAGEFSKLAADGGANVVAVDSDHDAIQRLYRENNRSIYTVLSDIDDLSGGRGWEGAEFTGLLTRLKKHADLTLMLALVHHLAISKSVPYARIAELASKLNSKYLVVEFIEHTDPIVQELAVRRARSPNEFTLQAQLAGFDKYFNKVNMEKLDTSTRHLALMEKK